MDDSVIRISAYSNDLSSGCDGLMIVGDTLKGSDAKEFVSGLCDSLNQWDGEVNTDARDSTLRSHSATSAHGYETLIGFDYRKEDVDVFIWNRCSPNACIEGFEFLSLREAAFGRQRN